MQTTPPKPHRRDLKPITRLAKALLPALILPIFAITTTLAASQTPTLSEVWRAEYPLEPNYAHRSDIVSSDLLLYYTTKLDTDLNTTHAHIYVVDKQTGQCLSRSEFLIMGQFEVNGHTFFAERLWLLLGNPEDHSAGRRTAVLNWRTGNTETIIDQKFNRHDVLLANNPLQVGNDVYFFESLAPASKHQPRSGADFRQFFSIYHSQTGELIARGDVLNPITGAPHTRAAYAEFAKNIYIFDGTPFAMRLDYIRFMNLRDEKLGDYTLGQPHVGYALPDDRYVVGWYFDELFHVSRPEHPIFGTRTRIFSWTPNTQPRLEWDAFDAYGLTELGGSWGSDYFWMVGPRDSISVFDHRGTLVKKIDNVEPFPDVNYIHPATNGLLVLKRSDIPDSDATAVPALAMLNGDVREITLPTGFVMDGERMLMPADDGFLYHVIEDSGQKWLVFARIQ